MKATRPLVVVCAAALALATAHCAGEPPANTADQLQVRPAPEPKPIVPRPEPQPQPKPTHTGDPAQAPPAR